jgi:AhpC/TSA family
MSDEDRFADLGEGDRRSAAERFEEQDRVNPEPDMPPKRPEVPRSRNKYAWLVGIVMLMFASVVLFRSLAGFGDAPGPSGLEGPPRNQVVPDFAAPLATGNAEGDANLCQRGGKCTEAGGRVPACQVTGDDVVNVCELRRKPLLLTFVTSRGADCEPQVDRVERIRRDFPEVSFATVMGGNDREDVEQIARRRGWQMPVAVDPDGQTFNLYGVGVCPTTVFAYAGGKVRKTRLGNLTESQLRTELRALLAGA